MLRSTKKKNDSHTCRLDQHTSQLETLERQVRTLITAIHDNNIGGHSAHVATNNNDDTRIDKLEEIVRQYIKSKIRTNTKINYLTSIIHQNHHDPTQGRTEQLAINSIGKLDHQSHTCRLDQHTSRLETLESQMRMLTTAIHARVVTNNNDDTRLDKLEEIVRQYIKSAILTNNRTNKKINSLTSTIADNDKSTQRTILDFHRGVRN